MVSEQERLERLQGKAAEIRQKLFGALLLVKDKWKEELAKSDEGLLLLERIEKAEDFFPAGSDSDSLTRLEETLEVIRQRTQAIFDLASFMTK